MSAVFQVCVIDDTADYRFLVEVIFKRYLPDYSLRLFVNGQAFLDTLPQLGERPNLVILDQHMPLLSGYQTLVALKQQHPYRSIPVVMMSADASHSEIKSFYQAGATTFIPKPMDFDALKEALLAACQWASNPSQSLNIPLT
jgi:DNA-binding NtrC family response regulator